MQYYKAADITGTATTGTFNIPWETNPGVSVGHISFKLPDLEPMEYYEDEKKEKPLSERTFVMIKPDAFERGLVGEVLDLVSQRGLKLIALKTVNMTPADCEQHYSHHVGKDFYPSLVEFMTSGPSLALVFEGNGACSLIRQLIGDSKHPSQVSPGSIRGRYAMDFPRNLIHGSKTYDEASHEYRLYLGTQDIFDEYRLRQMAEEFAERKERRAKEFRDRIDQGINLGDEVFAPDVLKAGDWIASRKGMSYITNLSMDSNNRIVIDHLDYFHHFWKEPNQQYVEAETYTDSTQFSWGGSALFLVGRDETFLDSFTSRPVADSKGKRYVFKNGRFLPVFKKKSQVQVQPIKLTQTHGIPWSSTHEDENGFFVSDVYDPINQIVMQVASKNDPVKWRILVAEGQELKGKQYDLAGCGVAQAYDHLKVWGKDLNPGQMSVLVRYGIPFAATYGDLKVHNLTGAP
jgi:nucleoside-diphosphate kinase